MERDAETLIRAASRKVGPGGVQAEPIATLWIDYTAGTSHAEPLFHGINTWHVKREQLVTGLWSTAGSLRVPPKREGHGPGGRMWRLDWENPRPDVPVLHAEVSSAWPGALVLVGGAAALR